MGQLEDVDVIKQAVTETDFATRKSVPDLFPWGKRSRVAFRTWNDVESLNYCGKNSILKAQHSKFRIFRSRGKFCSATCGPLETPLFSLDLNKGLTSSNANIISLNSLLVLNLFFFLTCQYNLSVFKIGLLLLMFLDFRVWIFLGHLCSSNSFQFFFVNDSCTPLCTLSLSLCLYVFSCIEHISCNVVTLI